MLLCIRYLIFIFLSQHVLYSNVNQLYVNLYLTEYCTLLAQLENQWGLLRHQHQQCTTSHKVDSHCSNNKRFTFQNKQKFNEIKKKTEYDVSFGSFPACVRCLSFISAAMVWASIVYVYFLFFFFLPSSFSFIFCFPIIVRLSFDII